MEKTATFEPEAGFFSPYGHHWEAKGVSANSTSGVKTSAKNMRWIVKSDFQKNSTVEDDLRAERFVALQEAIARLSLMNPSSEFFVEPGATRKAANFLALVSQNYEIEPPKLLPEDGNTLVLTWDIGDFRRYLGIDEDSYDLMDIHNVRDFTCQHEIPTEERAAITALLAELHLSSKSSSVR